MFLLWSSIFPSSSLSRSPRESFDEESVRLAAAAAKKRDSDTVVGSNTRLRINPRKLDSPASSQQMKYRLLRQMRRAMPLYIACVVLLLFISIIDSFSSSSDSSSSISPVRYGAIPQVARRSFANQKILTTKGKTFPKKTWQTWKIGPLGFGERDLQCARTWTARNPAHRYEVLTDDNDMEYIEAHYGPYGINRPDIIDLYRTVNATIIKADLLRYMIMYAEGGVYADIDVEALRPISRFIPERYDEADLDMVIGVEIDQPEFKDHPILGPKSQSFCQWTFMCKPRLPVMLKLIEQIMKWLKETAKKQRVPISQVHLDFDQVISGTGPSAFTTAILEHMTKQTGGRKKVTWDQFHGMAESKVVGGTLVLTVEAFAAGQGHSDSGNHNARTALVKHHYHASKWPTNHPRYTHPVYGPVEICNWEATCVRRWDEDVAKFKTLPKDEQGRLIGIKEQQDAAERQALLQQQQVQAAAGGAYGMTGGQPDPRAAVLPEPV